MTSLVFDERGAVSLMGLFIGLFAIGGLYLLLGLTQAIDHRERLQNSADAGAGVVGAIYARAMNHAVQYNHASQEAMAAGAAVQTLIDAEASVCVDPETREVTVECATALRRAEGLARSADQSIRQLEGDGLALQAEEAMRRLPGLGTTTPFLLSAPSLQLPASDHHDDRIVASVSAWLDENRDRFGSDLIVPLAGRTVDDIGSPYGNRLHPTLGYERLHAGVDFGAPTGTEILAAGAGTIRSRSFSSCGGNILEIDHGNGLVTRYLHISRFPAGAVPGRSVAAGELVAFVGNTGSCTTGPHLHFEVRLHGVPVDPEPYLRGGGGRDFSSELVRAAVAEVRRSWTGAGIRLYRRLEVPVEHRALRVVVAERAALEETESGVLIGTFGATDSRYFELRNLGRYAWAQSEFAGPEDAPHWAFQLRRFTLPDAGLSVPNCVECGGLAEALERFGGASTK
ncbi:MAG: M23 family metallopeptidase [Myxococcota bacterium]